MTGQHPAVSVVTDSTAYLPPLPVSGEPGRRLTVVPLAVVVNGVPGLETVDIDSATVAEALNARRVAVTTSRPSPEAFSQVYRELLDSGADTVLSVHLSARLSGTYDAAVLAAAEFDGKVEVIDTQSTGMGLGFPALAAADAAAAGGTLAEVRQAAVDAVARTTTLFYVDTLEFLRRGGRIGAAAALLGTALAVKPILHTTEEGVVVREKVRTASRALARLVDIAAESAGDADVDIAVHHLAAPDRADALLTTLKERLGERLRGAYLTEVGAVVGAHVGPGMVAVVVHRVA
ncbi:DegV family protein [Dactylosporangium sp. NPDC000555]|uniref:DegV family protein n=1 Tax=Dactylosporangium sp. NPDC000555 TaxID=3154260 RepID=UPI00331CC929